jgi:predicted transcriptional regulator
MSPPISEQRRNTTTPPPLSLQSVILLLNDRARWLIIEALADGEPRMINKLAKHGGKSPAATSKHVGLLRQLGLVRVTRRSYQLVEAFRPGPGQSEVDLGYCVIRFPKSFR